MRLTQPTMLVERRVTEVLPLYSEVGSDVFGHLLQPPTLLLGERLSSPVLLNAQQAYLQTSLARVQAQAARLADTVALYQALGGGWWNRIPVSEIAVQ